KYKVEPCPLPVKALKAMAVIPVNDPDRSRSDDATFVEGIFVQFGDRTIQSLDVYVNAAAAKDLEGCRAVAHQILRPWPQARRSSTWQRASDGCSSTRRTWKSQSRCRRTRWPRPRSAPTFWSTGSSPWGGWGPTRGAS